MTSESLQRAFRYLFEDEVTALKDLARSLPDNPFVVNIGAGAGTSGLAFMESREDLTLITVDITSEDSPFGSLYAEKSVFVQAGIPDGRYIQVCADSKFLGISWLKSSDWHRERGFIGNGHWAKYPVDLVFVDGDHSYRGAKGDILAWLPNIKEGGIMAVHDYGKREVYRNGPIDNAPHPLPWPGVDRAVRKFLCPFFEIVSHVETLISFRVTEEGRQKLNDHLAG